VTVDLIDVHAHLVPREFPEGPGSGTEARWPCMCHGEDNRATVMIADKPFREIDHRSWDAAVRIADMDQCGVARQALSPMPELLSYWFSPAAGLDMCRWMNDHIADAVARHPDRFSGLGIVPLQDPALAAGELGRLQAARLAGVELGSNINGAFLGDDRFEEFHAEAERLDLAVFVHALHPVGTDRLAATPDLVPFAAFPLDTALCAMSLIRAGVPERHPRLRFGFSHGGGAIIPLAHRLGQGARVTDNFGGRLTRSPAEYAAGFYYDNLVYETGYMSYLANEFAPGHVFCGTDYPYAIMETDPAGFIAAGTLADPDSVRGRAAESFLGLKQSA
jgi:aminocarboxymuconate-semialdehyde decarboxylase